MDGSTEAVQDLLDLTYGLSCGKQDINNSVHELMPDQQPRLQALIQLAQKYNMPVLLRQLDASLLKLIQSTKDVSDKYLRSIEEAVHWAIALHSTDMPKCKEALLQQIAMQADAEQLAVLTKALGAEKGVSILEALLTRMQPGYPKQWSLNSDMHKKGLRMCTEILAVIQLCSINT